MSDGTAEEALQRIFRVFDVNSDGQITEKELKRLVKDMFKLVKDEAPEEVDLEETYDDHDYDKNVFFSSGNQTVSYRKCIC